MSQEKPHEKRNVAKACGKDALEIQLLRQDFVNISPLENKYLILRWIYIERDLRNPFYEAPMGNFEMQELILLDMMKPREVHVDCNKHLRLSERDGFMFGFLLKLGFCLYFLCISDRFKGKDGKSTKLVT